MTRQLLFSITKKDLHIEYFSGKGAGGQYRNKHQNCVRIHHPASGAIATGQSHRSRPANMREALYGLVEKPQFKVWHAGAVQQALSGKSIDELVEEAMQPHNIKVEYKQKGRWVEEVDI